MDDSLRICVREDFSDSPGARYKKDGPYSGEQFYEELLLPKYKEAREKNLKLVIDLDGVWGYPSSFVSGSFGRLSIAYGAKEVLDTIRFLSEESSTREERIKMEVLKPERK